MSSITTKDGVEIFYKDWGKDSPLSSATAGRSRPMIGTRRRTACPRLRPKPSMPTC
jgi:hypothetical protein